VQEVVQEFLIPPFCPRRQRRLWIEEGLDGTGLECCIFFSFYSLLLCLHLMKMSREKKDGEKKDGVVFMDSQTQQVTRFCGYFWVAHSRYAARTGL
jgi:hypothetical protein